EESPMLYIVAVRPLPRRIEESLVIPPAGGHRTDRVASAAQQLPELVQRVGASRQPQSDADHRDRFRSRGALTSELLLEPSDLDERLLHRRQTALLSSGHHRASVEGPRPSSCSRSSSASSSVSSSTSC